MAYSSAPIVFDEMSEPHFLLICPAQSASDCPDLRCKRDSIQKVRMALSAFFMSRSLLHVLILEMCCALPPRRHPR